MTLLDRALRLLVPALCERCGKVWHEEAAKASSCPCCGYARPPKPGQP